MRLLKQILPILLASYFIYIGGGVMVANVCCNMCDTIKTEHQHQTSNHQHSNCIHKHSSHQCSENSCKIKVYYVDIANLPTPNNIVYPFYLFKNIEWHTQLGIIGENNAEHIQPNDTAPPLINTPRRYLSKLTTLLI